MSTYDESGRPIPDEEDIRDRIIAEVLTWLRATVPDDWTTEQIADAMAREFA